jgi:hypothetical protein
MNLQQVIYQKLISAGVQDKVKGVYFHVPDNSPFPYIYIDDFISENISTKNQEMYKITLI